MSDSDLKARVRQMEAAAAHDAEAAFTVECREFSTGQRSALRWVLSLLSK